MEQVYDVKLIFTAFDYHTGALNLLGRGNELVLNTTIPDEERERVLNTWKDSYPHKAGMGFYLFNSDDGLLWVSVDDFKSCLTLRK